MKLASLRLTALTLGLVSSGFAVQKPILSIVIKMIVPKVHYVGQ